MKIVETTAAEYYGKGYQDVQNRVPKIANTCADLDWKPVVPMDEALKRIFDAYREPGRRSAQPRGLSGTSVLLALKIDVDTLRGTREGVPNLVALLAKHGAGATFLFSLGPDHTGRAIKRVFRPGFFGKVRRTSVVQHYGVKTLLYGTLLPGPDIGRRAADVMRASRDAGFEIGIHTWDHVRWQDGVGRRRRRVDARRDAARLRSLHRHLRDRAARRTAPPAGR